jgi:hypothetical protein
LPNSNDPERRRKEAAMARDESSGWIVEEPRRLPWYVYVLVGVPVIAVGLSLAIIPVIVFFGLIYGW